MPALRPAPEFEILKWLNTDTPLTLADLRGKVIVAFAFQMLCPGCVEHSIPQARKVQAFFSDRDVAVIGLHAVFEHHEAMGEPALRAFLHEYRLTFPVGIDRPSSDPLDPIPATMRNYNMQGTPTLILIDRQGRLRKLKFGHEHDLVLGAEIMALMRESQTTNPTAHPDSSLALPDSPLAHPDESQDPPPEDEGCCSDHGCKC